MPRLCDPGQPSDDYRSGSGSDRGSGHQAGFGEESLQRHTLPRFETEIHERKT